MTTLLNTIADKWYNWQFAMLWQTAVLIAIIWALDLLIRRWAWPQVRYALWMLVLVKLLIPPTFTSPASITSHLPAAAQRVVISINSPPVKGEYPEEGRGLSVTTASVPQFEAKSNSSSSVPKGQNTIAGDAIPGTRATQNNSPPAKGEYPPQRWAGGGGITWKAWSMFVWLAGIVVLSGWLILRLSGLRKEHLKSDGWHGQAMSRARPRDPLGRGFPERFGEQLQTAPSVIPAQAGIQLPERFGEQFQAAGKKLNLKKLPQVILTDKVSCPAVFGVFRPVLLMPAEKFDCSTGILPVTHGQDGHATMSARDVEHILLHELAHIKRGDLLVHAVTMTLQILYWFNPLLWLIRKTLQNLRELCCDATVAKLLRENTVHYRQTLLETARQLLAEPVEPGLGLLGLFENSNWLVTRLQWLEKNTWKNRPLRIATIILLVSVMTTCVLPMAVFNPGPPNFVIKGTVTDAETGKPIAGAEVGDNKEYNKGEFCTVTDPNGNYEYKTWYEEHGTIAEAQGYHPQLKGFGTKLFGSEKEKVINFELVSATVITLEQVVKQAESEARLLNHEYIGTEHLLLALVSDEDAAASVILKELGVDVEKVRLEVGKCVKAGLEPVKKKKLPLTPRAKKALEYAKQEAKSLHHDSVMSEDVLLGLLQVQDSVAAQVLKNLGVTYDAVHQKITAPRQSTTESTQNLVLSEVEGSELKTPNFTATLPNGVTVELVGVCEHPSEGKQWWKPDGSELKERPWEKINGSVSAMWGRKAYEFALKLNYPIDNVPGHYVHIGTGSSVSGGIQKFPTSFLRWEISELPKKLEMTDVNISIASGQWQTRNKQKSPWHGVYMQNVVWQAPIAVDDKTVLSVSHSFATEESRLVAIDIKGNQHIGYGTSGSIDKKTLHMQHTFNVKLEDIKEFQLQTRPYECYTFKNVSLRPGVKTEVEMENQSSVLSPQSSAEAAEVRSQKAEGGIDITPAGFEMRFDSKRLTFNLVVSIENKNVIAIPKHRIRYYRGDAEKNLDETGNPHSGWHEAGPVEPGKTWNERTSDFHLPDGDYTFTVVLDYDNAIPETNEANNRATLHVTIQDGQIVEKTGVEIENQSSAPSPQDSEKKTEEGSKPISPDVRMNVMFKKDMLLTDALRMLSEMYKVNIVPSQEVATSRSIIGVTNLYDVNFEQVLKAVCGISHTYEIKDDFVYVYTNEEYENLPKDITLEQAQKTIAAFFAKEYKSVSKFNALEWGELFKRDDGTQSLRCKYETTFWNKDKIQITDSMFFFDKTGKVDSLINLQEPAYTGGKTEEQKQP